MIVGLNRGWDFYFDKNKDEKVVVDIPHTVKETPFDAFDESVYQTVCKYVRRIPLTEEMKEKALILHFAGVAHKAEVFVNGKLKGVHNCGYTAFDVDISKAAFENMQKPSEKKDTETGEDNKDAEDSGEKKATDKDGSIIGEALIEVVVDTNENINQPPFGNIIDYMTYGGIYREVHLEIRNKLYIKDVYYCFNQMDIYGGMLHTKLMLSTETKDKVYFRVKLSDTNGLVVSEGCGRIGVQKAAAPRPRPVLADIPGANLSGSAESSEGAGGIAALTMTGFDEIGHGVGAAKMTELGDNTITDIEGVSHNFDLRLSDVILWRPENPLLYNVTVQLLTETAAEEKKDDNKDEKDEKKEVTGGKETAKKEQKSEYDNLTVIDEVVTKVGLRSVEWREDGFYLNGKKYKLRGINRHQSFPYVGYAMPDRLQKEDAAIIKNELRLNCVRTSHYPQAQSFYEACDELGLFVITEVPGWQHIGDEEWKRLAVVNVREMVSQYRNHPSVILWGVRINESADEDDLYTKSNETAKELAPLDFTGGVRNFAHSRLIEDVYTYNDFLHDGKRKGASLKKDITYDTKKAYLITEFNGHMYPAKPFDSESVRVEQALRHAAVVNEVCWQEDIAGCLGWCMFDYNTHRQFGAGDRICYHGVMDMFRNPKYAADFYRSQSDAEPVLFVETGMDMGDYPEGVLQRVCIFTNFDSVKLYQDDKLLGEYFPDREHYGNLPHPPVIIDEFIGDRLTTEERFTKEKAAKIKEILFAFREYGRDNLPLMEKLTLTKLNSIDKITPAKLDELYNKYILFWACGAKKYVFEGIKDGTESVKVVRTPAEKVELEVKTGSTELVNGDMYDATAVRFCLKDQNGRIMSYTFDSVLLETEGSIELIGPSATLLRGGMGGTYVKTRGTGDGKLTIKFRDIVKTVEFTVKGK